MRQTFASQSGDARAVEKASRSPQTVSCACPSCGTAGLQSFYRVEGIPTHSCLLMDSYDEAVTHPRGELELAFCLSCGFITNVKYDATFKNYSPRYEETQHFSVCFDNFARQLAQRWVEQYRLRGKRILEIGCGKGEFLELLCTLGANRGIGFDPGVRPERLSKEANERICFVRDYYSEKYHNERVDAICCRHTLEHIDRPNDLIGAIRSNIGDRKDVVLLFELPDTTRVLREYAFWDVYYEHCSYFTAGSLRRLFQRNHFDVVELERAFDNQYLLLVARPGEKQASGQTGGTEDLDVMANDVSEFHDRHARLIEQWRTRLHHFAANGQRAAIWGGGSKAVAFLTTLGLKSEIDFVIDINPHKHGKFIPGTGHRVVSPDHLRRHPPDVVVVMNPIYVSEIRSILNNMGLAPQLLPV